MLVLVFLFLFGFIINRLYYLYLFACLEMFSDMFILLILDVLDFN